MREQRRKLMIPTYVVLTFFAVIWITPMLLALAKSFQVNGLDNYVYVLTYEKIPYFNVIFNSFFISASTALIVCLIASLAGYAFSKLRIKGGKIIYGALPGPAFRRRRHADVLHHQQDGPHRHPSGLHHPHGGLQRPHDADDDQELL